VTIDMPPSEYRVPPCDVWKHFFFNPETAPLDVTPPAFGPFEICVVKIDKLFISEDHAVLRHESAWCPHGYRFYWNQSL